jgi:HlyD family secretion protein
MKGTIKEFPLNKGGQGVVMNKKTWFWIGIVLIMAISATLFFVFFRGNVKKVYQFTKIERGTIESTISCTGTLQFYYTENVVAQASGVVKRLFVDFNQKIRKGQILALIDDAAFKLDEEIAKANLEKANVQLAQSQTDFSNTLDFFNQKFKSQSDLDTAKLNLATAQNAVQTSRTALDSARLNLKYSTILAPISGIIVQKNINVGDAVTANQTSNPAFIVASEISKMQTLASVDESDVGQVKIGQKARFTVQAYPDKKFEGRASQIRLQPQVVQNVVNYTVVIDLFNKEGLLLPGMTATIDIITQERTNVFKVPNPVLKFRATTDMWREAFSEGNSTNKGARIEGINRRQNGGKTDTLILWTQDKDTKILKPIGVKTGVSDGQFTEIIGKNLTEGLEIMSGISSDSPKTQNTSSQARSPFLPARGPGGGKP